MTHRSYLSPDRKQVLLAEMAHDTWLPCRLVPFDGSSPGKPVGPAPAQCTDAAWSPDGKFLYLNFQGSIYAIPLRPGQMLPPIPPSGFRSKEDVAALPGAQLIPQQGAFPGPNPSIYAFTKISTHRNIYRVSVP
jgi:hypothetical protein